jgi:hypothetical protein
MPTLLAIEPARYHHLTGTRGPKSATRFNVPLDATGRLPDYTREKKMYQLTMSACQVVSGGNAQGGNAQVCSSLPNGGSQCTSNNGRSMVIQTYDSKGVLTNTTVCTENRQGSVSLSLAKQATGEVKGGGGTSCSSKTPASGNGSGGGSGATQGGQLLIYSPFFYGAP